MWLEEYENKFSIYGQTTILLQSVEKPVVYNFTPKGPSDGLLHRGAYGLYFAGIFISLYGVYLMMNDKTKKCSHWFFMVILLHVWRCCISLLVTWCVFLQVDFRVGHFHCREKCSPFQGLFKSLLSQISPSPRSVMLFLQVLQCDWLGLPWDKLLCYRGEILHHLQCYHLRLIIRILLSPTTCKWHDLEAIYRSTTTDTL